MNDILCPRCGAFADQEIGGIYCSNDDCSWGIDGTNYEDQADSYSDTRKGWLNEAI